MTDIVRRLRSYGPHHHDVRLHFEAADEIEHLTLDLHTERAAVVALRAELAARAETGPPMSRGTNADGTPKMGTMRDCMLDYMQAAEAEAGEADKLRAEIAALRKSASLRVQFHAAELADVTAELEQARKATP